MMGSKLIRTGLFLAVALHDVPRPTAELLRRIAHGYTREVDRRLHTLSSSDAEITFARLHPQVPVTDPDLLELAHGHAGNERLLQ